MISDYRNGSNNLENIHLCYGLEAFNLTQIKTNDHYGAYYRINSTFYIPYNA